MLRFAAPLLGEMAALWGFELPIETINFYQLKAPKNTNPDPPDRAQLSID
ncbi:MAG TPA: hypothetical protein V6C88_19935 [Chroococcidiopsis sp.]